MDSTLILTCLAIVTASSSLAALGLLAVRRFVKAESLKASHEVGGYLLSIVGTIYAVVLGLVVVDATTKYQQAMTITEQEANCLADIYLLSNQYPEKKKEVIHDLCRAYARQLVDQEWKLMNCSRQCPQTQGTALELMQAVCDFEPATEKEIAIYPITVQEACSLWDNRRARINLATHGMPMVEWVTLLVGGSLTIAFTYFFAINSLRTQLLMTVIVTTITSLNLYLVYVFAHPFSGLLRVTPDAIELDRSIFEKVNR